MLTAYKREEITLITAREVNSEIYFPKGSIVYPEGK
jgi:hypothetical protein